METLVQDLRFSLRSWSRQPGFALAVIATLALGIGANVAIFTVIDGVLLQPLPYPEPEKLAILQTDLPLQDSSRLASSGPELLAYRAESAAFSSIGAIWYRPGALTDDASEPEEIDMGFISEGFLRTLGVAPQLGRFVAASEDVPNGPRVIVLSHGLWMRRYGGDGDIVGKRVELDGVLHTVVGVMPNGFRMLLPPDAGVPELLSAWVPWGGTYNQLPRTWRVFSVIARLGDDSDLARGRAELRAAASKLREEFPEDYDASGLDVQLRPLSVSAVAHVRSALWMLLGAVGVVFLVACANVANLMLVRASGADREMVLRVALGASRLRLVRQLATESAVLSFVGAAVGTAVARWGVEALKLLDPGRLPRLASVAVGGRIFLIAMLVAVVTAIVFGIVSCLHVSRGGVALRVGSRSAGDAGRQRARRLLVALEIAMSVVLLTGAALLARSFSQLARVDPGFDPSGVMTVKLSLVDSQYPYSDPAPIADFYRLLTQRIDELPRVRAVGATSQLPLDGSYGLTPYSYETPEGIVEWESVVANYRGVTPGLLEALGARLVEGRFFDWTDDLEHPTVVVIDDKLARSVFRGKSAIGERLLVQTFVAAEWKQTWSEIVGVVEHVRQHPSEEGVEQIYLPHQQSPQRTMALAIRTDMPPDALTDVVRAEVRQLNGDQPVHGMRSLDAYMADAMAPTRFASSLLALFAVVAIVVAAVGLYGVISYSVGQRRSEIGIRLALGATPLNIRRSILAEGAVLTALGLTLGVGAALGFSRILSSHLFQVRATDPPTFLSIPLLLAAISLAAVYVPAYRASKLDPTSALRAE